MAKISEQIINESVRPMGLIPKWVWILEQGTKI